MVQFKGVWSTLPPQPKVSFFNVIICIYYVVIVVCTALHVLGFCLPTPSSSASLVAWGMWATDT